MASYNEAAHFERRCASLTERSWRSLPRHQFLQVLHLFNETISDGRNRAYAKSCLSAVVFVQNLRPI